MHAIHTIATMLIHILFAQLRPSHHKYFFLKDRSKDPYSMLQTVDQFFLEIDWRGDIWSTYMGLRQRNRKLRRENTRFLDNQSIDESHYPCMQAESIVSYLEYVMSQWVLKLLDEHAFREGSIENGRELKRTVWQQASGAGSHLQVQFRRVRTGASEGSARFESINLQV